MAYNKKTWAPRIVPFPGRRKLITTGIADTWDVQRAEGTATQEGDGWSSANMNDFENRVEAGINANSNAIGTLYSATSTYALGSYVLYQSVLYRCTTAITVAEAWTASKWTSTNLSSEVTTINTKLTWIKVHESIGTSVTATIDFTQYKEIKIYLNYQDGHVYTWNMLSDYLKTTDETLRDGYYISNADCALAYVNIKQSGITNSGFLANQSASSGSHALTIYAR